MNPVRTILLTLAVIPLYAADYSVSGPHTHDNLSLYLIHAANSTRHYLTLREALDQKKAVVYETGNVNELAIENLSKSEELYIQSGDIVKGGRQDRTLKDDLIIPTSSGRIPLTSFCVEHGRWTPRGREASESFDSAPQSIATRQMKMAVKLSANQQEVWRQVATAQHNLSMNLSSSVAESASPSSFMLSLESRPVQKAVQEYIQAFSNLAETSKDAIGFAFAVNGKVSSADIYANHDLFLKLWPKLLRASAVEAIAEARRQVKAPAPGIDSVRAFIAAAEGGRARTSDLTGRTKLTVKETAGNAMFETRDRSAQGIWIHRSYLTK